jgi:hypothetical protein
VKGPLRAFKIQLQRKHLWVLPLLAFLSLLVIPGSGYARSNVTPWASDSQGFQNLVIGASSGADIQAVMGVPPDEIIKSEIMYPVIENYFYYEEGGSGAATVFILQGGLLAGLSYKSASNQMMDLSYFLQNNNDRLYGMQYNPAGYSGYFPSYPLYGIRNW